MAQHETSKESFRSHGRGRKASRGGDAVSQRRAQSEDTETGERDDVYGLISVLYHALQGAETYTQYVADAERSGDDALVQFFTECRSEEAQRAARAKELLVDRLETLEDGEDDEDEDEDEDGG
jgi:hypothetical protein